MPRAEKAPSEAGGPEMWPVFVPAVMGLLAIAAALLWLTLRWKNMAPLVLTIFVAVLIACPALRLRESTGSHHGGNTNVGGCLTLLN